HHLTPQRRPMHWRRQAIPIVQDWAVWLSPPPKTIIFWLRTSSPNGQATSVVLPKPSPYTRPPAPPSSVAPTVLSMSMQPALSRYGLPAGALTIQTRRHGSRMPFIVIGD